MIAVVVYGLYGAATYQYGLSSKGLRTGALLKFFDVMSYMLNGMVFFYVGSSIVNFFLRCVREQQYIHSTTAGFPTPKRQGHACCVCGGGG